jgi:hypothetical protein
MVSQRLTLTRLPDWRARLRPVLADLQSQGHAWGRSDCLLGLADGVVHALTGKRIAGQWRRGRYRSADGALRVMWADGFDNLSDLLASVLPRVHMINVQDGDLAAVPSGDAFGFGLAMVNGGGLLAFGSGGLIPLARASAVAGFKVG